MMLQSLIELNLCVQRCQAVQKALIKLAHGGNKNHLSTVITDLQAPLQCDTWAVTFQQIKFLFNINYYL